MPEQKKFDPFKPQEPQIPGVPAEKPATRPAAPREPAGTSAPVQAKGRSLPMGLIVAAAAVVVVISGVVWWVHGSSASQPPPAAVEAPAAAPAPVVKAAPPLPVGPGEIGTASELSKAWSSKRFAFTSPTTFEKIPALAVRLPGGALWGISLHEPYGACDLEYVTDLETLSSKYHVHAEHPMVVNPCSKTVYDLTRYGNGPNGLVRGAIVRGRAMRPPIGIEVTERAGKIVAVRME